MLSWSGRSSSVFDPPTLLEHFLSSPLQFFAWYLHALALRLGGPAYTPPRHRAPIRVVCISDTHCRTQAIPPGDVLIHAGDLTNAGTVAEIQPQVDWLKRMPHPHKVVVAGNHDSFFDPTARKDEDAHRRVDWDGVHYLESDAITLTFPTHHDRKLHVYGAPGIPRCGGDDFAFQYDRRDDVWSGTVPAETDVLVTHTPPRGHLDLPVALGCQFLLREAWRVRPSLHVFGHVHADHGKIPVHWDRGQMIYEKMMARPRRGVIRGLVDLAGWMDLTRLVWHDATGVLWRRIWGGASKGGWMVNAALAYRDTGQLGNPVEIIEL
ncbi:MAG: hypothetical protein M1833_001187 [Piccolia ochrophora]|nr:MAG: hypothetical protein M1833_001187 [Piccolia ochrophora]